MARVEELREKVQQSSAGNRVIRVEGDFVHDPLGWDATLSLMARVVSFKCIRSRRFSEDKWLLSNPKGQKILGEILDTAEKILKGKAYRFNYGWGRSSDVEEDSQNFWIDVVTKNPEEIKEELRAIKRLCGGCSYRGRKGYKEWTIPILNVS